MVGQRNTTYSARILGTAVSMVLGLGLAVSAAPAFAQLDAAAGRTATGTGNSGTSTAQPPSSTDLDTDFWVLVRDSADPNALQSYLSSFPSGKFTDEARQKIAALRKDEKSAELAPAASPAPPAPPAIAPPAPVENKDLARALQTELKRVG